MGLVDINGNNIAPKTNSVLNGADVFFFGDSNVECSAGYTLNDVGSWYQQLAKEFSINSWTNKGVSGLNTWQVYGKFKEWATDANVATYNKESTVFLFWTGTNDEKSNYENHPYNGNQNTTSQPNGIAFIKELIATKFPKATFFWFIPPLTDWTKWGNYTEDNADYYAERNMAEKIPLIIENLNMWGIPFFNVAYNGGIFPAMLSDGVHLGGGSKDYTTDAVYRAYRVIRECLMNK